MAEDYWATSQLSIAKYYGGIRLNNIDYKIVNKDGITLMELSAPSSKHYVKDGMAIPPGEPADLVDNKFIPFFRKLGRDKFITVLMQHPAMERNQLLQVFKETIKSNGNPESKV